MPKQKKSRLARGRIQEGAKIISPEARIDQDLALKLQPGTMVKNRRARNVRLGRKVWHLNRNETLVYVEAIKGKIRSPDDFKSAIVTHRFLKVDGTIVVLKTLSHLEIVSQD